MFPILNECVSGKTFIIIHETDGSDYYGGKIPVVYVKHDDRYLTAMVVRLNPEDFDIPMSKIARIEKNPDQSRPVPYGI